jgi:hypothetical protein
MKNRVAPSATAIDGLAAACSQTNGPAPGTGAVGSSMKGACAPRRPRRVIS